MEKRQKKKRYGSETYNNSAKRAITNIAKYGNACSLHGKEQEIKTHQTWLMKYGCENRLDSAEVQKQMSQAVFEKHGVYNSFQIPEVIRKTQYKNSLHQDEITAKIKQTKLNKSIEQINKEKEYKRRNFRTRRYYELFNDYVIPLFTLDEFVNCSTSIYEKKWMWKCLRCNHIFYSLYTPYKTDIGNIYGRCLECFPQSKSDGISREELEVTDFVKSVYNGTILTSKRVLKNINVKGSHGLQIDIFMPDLRIGIEYNGIYFHQFSNKNNGYHLHKTELAEMQGIKLVHIRSDQWKIDNDNTKKFLSSFINNEISVNDYYKNENTIIVDRSLFNRCCIPTNYQLKEIMQPSILDLTENGIHYQYEDCGYLVYVKQ